MTQRTSYKDFISKDECEVITKFILENEQRIKSLGPDVYPGTGNDSLTGRYSIYNFLRDSPGEILIPKLKEILGECVVQCWANIFRKGEGICKHRHGPHYISGNLFLSGPSEGTIYYSNIEKNSASEMVMSNEVIENVPGELTLFPSESLHEVPNNKYEEPRISMAFDIYTKKMCGEMRRILYETRETPERMFWIR